MIDFDAAVTEVALALEGLGYHVYAELPSGGAETPAAVIAWPDLVKFHVHAGNGGRIDIAVMIAEATANMGAAQQKIRGAMSWPGTVAGALEAHQPSTGYRSLQVVSAGNVRTLQNGSGTALVVDLDLELYT